MSEPNNWNEMAESYWHSASDHTAKADARTNVAFAEDKPGRCVLSQEERVFELSRAKHHREQAKAETGLAFVAVLLHQQELQIWKDSNE